MEQYLLMTEFAYNNTQDSTIGTTPFSSNYGFYRWFSISIPTMPLEKTEALLKKLHHDINLELNLAQERLKEMAGI